MAATSDEEMEKLLSLADQITTDFTAGISQIQTLKSTLTTEQTARQALELKLATLTSENERLKTLHVTALTNLTHHLQNSSHSSNEVKRELEELKERYKAREEEYRRERGVDEGVIRGLRRKVREVEERCEREVEDLRCCVGLEQEEKRRLIEKVRVLDKEVVVAKAKVGEGRGVGDKMVDVLKEKLMRLRRENEVLKRRVGGGGGGGN